MKIDYHVHIGHDSNRWGFRLTPEQVLSGMDALGIDKSVVFACPNITPAESNPYFKENEMVLEASQNFSRLTPFMFVHPYRDSVSYLERHQTQFSGFKVYCSAEGMNYPYNGIHRLETVQYMLRTGKPILFHIGKQNGERIRDLFECVSAAESPIVLAHAGRFFRSDLESVSRIPSAYIDIAPLRLLIERPMFVSQEFEFDENFNDNCCRLRDYLVPLFDQRLLWGSDRPWPDNLGTSGFEGEFAVYACFKDHLGELKL